MHLLARLLAASLAVALTATSATSAGGAEPLSNGRDHDARGEGQTHDQRRVTNSPTGTGFYQGERPDGTLHRAAAPLADALEPVRKDHRLPALAAVVVRGSQVIARGAVGRRRADVEIPVTTDDRFHIGSITKSMTATLAAMLVERGVLSWQTTLSEVFPELTNAMHRDFGTATLEQLLAHRAGFPKEPPAAIWQEPWQRRGTATEQRLRFVRALVAEPPVAAPGTRFEYSNAGYAAAGAIIERRTGKPWERLMREMLFEPLGMTSAGFGPPATAGQTDQPWGHRAGLMGLRAVAPGPEADNPPAIGPAGTVHCSLDDLARFVIFHLDGERGGTALLGPESFKRLHAPLSRQDYALGWVVTSRSWAGGRALTHAGSNTMFYAVVWLAPEKRYAVIVATNVGGDNAAKACDEAAGQLIKLFAP